MCYRVVTHTLCCDVQPVMSDGVDLCVDPFAPPHQCRCFPNETIRPWLRCESHGCCMQTAKMVWCPDVEDCAEVVEMHRYHKAQSQPRCIWANELTNKFGFDLLDKIFSDPDWRQIPVLDELLFPDNGLPPLTSLAPQFLNALENLTTVGRLIADTQSSLLELEEDVKDRRTRHDVFHGEACERVLNEWECSFLRRIETGDVLIEQMRKALAKQIELLYASFKLVQRMALPDDGEEELDSLMVKALPVVGRDEEKE
ncbi:hypothetical protein FDECE_9168 [Fusarium decemcellulare]|nr:hypothetical protein FDECE_9168 [Fusarium decemcellulare]